PDRRPGDLLDRLELGEGPEREAELAPPDRAARRARVRLPDRRGDVVRGETEGAEPVGIDLDLDFVLGLADHRDARHPGELLEPAGMHVLGDPGDAPEIARAGEAEHRDRAL